MTESNGLDMGSIDYSERREDLSFIVRYNWKTSYHLKEAIQILLAARLEDCSGGEPKNRTNTRKKSDVLDQAEFEEIRNHLASNPQTPVAVLNYLVKYGSPTVQERIAENPQATPEILAALSRSSHTEVRCAVAENNNATLSLLTTLSADPDADVRYRVAESSHVPEEVLQTLADDDNPYVRHRAKVTLSRLEGGHIIEGQFPEHGRGTPTRLHSVSSG